MTLQSVAQAPQIDDPVLRLANIQGDVLVGLQKDAECFVFFSIRDAASFQKSMRDIAKSGLITSAAEAVMQENRLAAARFEGSKRRFPILGLNVGFTIWGLQKLIGKTDLGISPATALDPSFLAGAAARGIALGDDTWRWLLPFSSGTPHGVMLVTGPDELRADQHADEVIELFDESIDIVHREMGVTRPQRGHEHFGFRDGISQPAVRGLIARQNPLDREQGLPGQDLVWPGEFVFDYPRQAVPRPDGSTRKGEKGERATAPAQWMIDGSFMVWRRLEQDVLAFRDAVRNSASALGMDPDMLAARMVGRWPSGAPLITAPLQDDPRSGGDPFHNNDFKFGNDPHQRRCPYAAHIRKTHPRDDLGRGSEAFVQSKRLRRAGIPFGPEVGDNERVGAEASRGLMFVCYQTSIVRQFEFIHENWVNAPDFPCGKRRPGGDGSTVHPGRDPLIGQAAGAPNAARVMDEPVPNYPTGALRAGIHLPRPFVRSTGAGYFFMPSLRAMRDGPIVGT